MSNFNTFLKDAHHIFRKDQMHVDGIFLETPLMSKTISGLLDTYKDKRVNFLEEIEVSFFELGNNHSKTCFYLYFLVAEMYCNVFNPQYATDYLTQLVKILFYVKKMDSDTENNAEKNMDIVKACTNGLYFMIRDFETVSKQSIHNNLYHLEKNFKNINTNLITMDIICQATQFKLPIIFKIYRDNNDLRNQVQFIRPRRFLFLRPDEYQTYPESLKMSIDIFMSKLITGNEDFIWELSHVVNCESQPMIYYQHDSGDDGANKKRMYH